MLLKRIIATVIISILLLSSGTICGAIYEEKIVSSAEEIVAFWENLLSSNLNIVIYNPEMKYWHVNRLVLVNRSLDFDIKKTDSIVTPYQLTIRLSLNRWHNRRSPNANSDYEYENRIRGFKTADDALANTGNSDFEEAKYTYVELISRKMTILYVLKNKTWILKGGNDYFDAYIGQHISDVNNAHLFKNVLSVPIK
jgi:hypothetical protein